MLRNVVLKFAFCCLAFTSGLAWGIAAEAHAAGIPLAAIFSNG